MRLDALYAVLFSTRTGQSCTIPPQESRSDVRTIVTDGIVHLCTDQHDRLPITIKEAFEQTEITELNNEYCMNPAMPILHEFKHVFDAFPLQVIKCISKLHLTNQQKLSCMSRGMATEAGDDAGQ